MNLLFLGALGFLALAGGIGVYRRLAPVTQRRVLRWGVGGLAALLGVALALFRRFDLAAFLGVVAFSVLRTGRIGPFNLNRDTVSDANVSKVRSRYFAMELDHDSGSVNGRVIAGQFRGTDLIDLGEMDTRALIEEITPDADSVSLLESWLDANRAGWREYFEETAAGGGSSASPEAPPSSLDEALAVLGLKAGAAPEEIQAAHHKLMKAVHPDGGGSDFLAAKINAARDLLLKARGNTK